MFTLAQGCSHISPVLTTGPNIDIDCAVPNLNQLVHNITPPASNCCSVNTDRDQELLRR